MLPLRTRATYEFEEDTNTFSQEVETYRFGGAVADILVQKSLKILHEALNVFRVLFQVLRNKVREEV